MDTENLEQLEKLMDRLSNRQALDLLLVVAGSRPACLVMDPEEDLKDQLTEFCSSTGLHFRIEEDNTGGLGKEGMFISQKMERFDRLKNSKGRFYGLSDRHVGSFLGFPDEDIDYFHEHIVEGPVEPETREKKQEMISRGIISEREWEVSRLVSYVPKPSEKGIRRAVSRGKSYVEDLKGFDSEKDADIASRVLQDFYGKTVDFEAFYT